MVMGHLATLGREVQDACREAGALEALANRLLDDPHAHPLVERAAAALVNLSCDNDRNCKEMRAVGCIHALVGVLQVTQPLV